MSKTPGHSSAQRQPKIVKLPAQRKADMVRSALTASRKTMQRLERNRRRAVEKSSSYVVGVRRAH